MYVNWYIESMYINWYIESMYINMISLGIQFYVALMRNKDIIMAAKS